MIRRMFRRRRDRREVVEQLNRLDPLPIAGPVVRTRLARHRRG